MHKVQLKFLWGYFTRNLFINLILKDSIFLIFEYFHNKYSYQQSKNYKVLFYLLLNKL